MKKAWLGWVLALSTVVGCESESQDPTSGSTDDDMAMEDGGTGPDDTSDASTDDPMMMADATVDDIDSSVPEAGMGDSDGGTTDDEPDAEPPPDPCDLGQTAFVGGDGAEQSPYEICNVDQLFRIAEDGTAHYVLTDDINLNNITVTPIASLSGSLNGAGHTLSNLGLSGSQSFIAELSGTLRNLTFEDATITDASQAAVAVGELVEDSGALVRNVHVTGDSVITGVGNHVGGVIRVVRPGTTASRVSFDGNITNTGTFTGGVVDSCMGLCSGIEFHGTLAGATKTGGVVQQLNGILENSANHGSVSGGSQSGGLVSMIVDGATIRDSYTDGALGAGVAGAIVGDYFDPGVTDPEPDTTLVQRVYAAGTMTNGAGLLVSGSITIEDSVWDTDITGATNAAGGTGLTTAQMNDPGDDAFENWGLPWVHKPGENPLLVGCDPAGAPFGAGDGSEADPFTICAVEHLLQVGANARRHFQLVTDLDMTASGFTQIEEFSGVFDGGSNTLSNFSADGPEAAFIRDLTGTVRNLDFDSASITGGQSSAVVVRLMEKDSGARVQNVHVTNSTVAGSTHLGGAIATVQEGTVVDLVSFQGAVTATGRFAGGVIDSCAGRCRRLSFNGTVDANQKIGGVVQQLNGILEQSVARGTLTAPNGQVGGLVGLMAEGVVRDSYSMATVSSGGGVVGLKFNTADTGAGEVERCFAAGPVTSGGGIVGGGSNFTVTDSVWDTEATGQPGTSGGGTGLTTAEMQDPDNSAFDSWGNVWVMGPGHYPSLSFEQD